MGSIQRKVVLIVAVLLLAVACGKGKDEDKKKPSNKWDKMEWNEGKWGAVETHSYQVLIA